MWENCRREFIRSSTLAGFGAFFSMKVLGDDGVNQNQKDHKEKKIGGISLLELWKQYRIILFDQFIPNMDHYVVDHKYGGFMTNVDIRTGERISTEKRAWYEGRGIWVYSFIYNNIKQDPALLEVARKSKEFILKRRPADGEFWNSSFSREGEPLSGPGDIFGNLYIAEGLAEYAKASCENENLTMAKEIILSSLSRYDQPDYSYPTSYAPDDAPRIRGPRMLNHWMVFLHIATQILKQEADPKIEHVANRCIDAVMNRHLNPRYQLLNYSLNHDLSLPNGAWAQFSSVGIGIQTLWMILYEADRRQDTKLFQKAADIFKRHVRVAYDGVYGGYFNTLNHVNKYEWALNKVLSLHTEILIGTLFLVEHIENPWEKKCFFETNAYIQKKFIRSDYKFWVTNGNRKVSNYSTDHVDHYHFPRHLMYNSLILERMISRG